MLVNSFLSLRIREIPVKFIHRAIGETHSPNTVPIFLGFGFALLCCRSSGKCGPGATREKGERRREQWPPLTHESLIQVRSNRDAVDHESAFPNSTEFLHLGDKLFGGLLRDTFVKCLSRHRTLDQPACLIRCLNDDRLVGYTYVFHLRPVPLAYPVGRLGQHLVIELPFALPSYLQVWPRIGLEVSSRL